MRKRLEKEIAEFDLPTSHQFGVLYLLSKKNMSQKEISNATLADEPSTTRMLDRMIKKDLIGKEKNKEDKRKQIVYITDKGQKLLERIMPIVKKNNQYVENLLEEDELELLFDLLNKINSQIQK
jgi:DNA-binding MarR family transcriptional regulator